MASASLQHRLPASAQHLRVLAAIALPRRYHADAAVSVVLVVVVYKALHPLLSFLSIVEAVTGVQVIAALLKRTEEGLRIRIVVADSRTTVREGNSVLLKQSQSGSGLHARTIV